RSGFNSNAVRSLGHILRFSRTYGKAITRGSDIRGRGPYGTCQPGPRTRLSYLRSRAFLEYATRCILEVDRRESAGAQRGTSRGFIPNFCLSAQRTPACCKESRWQSFQVLSGRRFESGTLCSSSFGRRANVQFRGYRSQLPLRLFPGKEPE